MDIELSKLGERGQIVIPQEIRTRLHMKKGEKFLVISENDDIIFRPLKKIKSLEQIEEDIIDMQIANKRWKEIENGEKVVSTKEDFLKEMESW
jgi:AbrB family looped-hinge helix DNA binding protein